MRLAFLNRLEEGGPYLRLPEDEHAWDGAFYSELGYGVIEACFLVDVSGLLDAARTRMVDSGRLREERFEVGELVVDAGSASEAGRVRWRDIEAGRVIFCDGVESFSNPYFSRLPFAPNKGEALLVEIDGLAAVAAAGAQVFKKGLSIIPWRDGLFWVGSSYEWSFEHAEPTEVFSAKDRGGAAGMGEAAVPYGLTLGGGAAGYVGASSVCGVSSAVSGSGDLKWDGDEGVFIGAVFCAADGGAFG
jgi:hypothetical protein